MFGPPGLQLLGQGSGISLFSNATLPFLLATSPTSNGSEPSLPIAPHAYGFNLLLLGNNSAAALDTPQPSYISSVQDLLATGESWNITASVNAVVAEFNNSKAEDPNKYQYFCVEFCDKAQRSSGAFTHQSMMNKQSLELANEPSPGPQTLQYLSFGPPGTDPGITYENTCEDFCTYSYLYSVNRRNCHGTWSVTRGGITLIDGNCDGNASPEVQQHVVDGNRLFLGVCYISSLTELLGAFVTNRNGSVWMSPYMATGVATMVWSRITAIDSAERRTTYNNTQKAASFVSDNDDTGAVKDASLEDLRIFYPAYNETVVYTRPTLLKSYWLYAVFALQPLLILVFLTLSLWLHSTPIAGGFGLISILAGLEPDSIRLLAGAGLSGDLEKPTKLIISTTHGSDANSSQGDVKYVVALPSQARWQNGKLKSGTTYH
ncbi:hypothetical protein E2P81_ATG10423 [Venturia nashicola]|nr:hypothetical protein E2P81_ATG10423 [Venturia nashicola]